MRARAGDPPRTMAQKVLAGRADGANRVGSAGDGSRQTIEVKVDQVVLARTPGRAFADALACGLKKTRVEVAVAYDTACVTDASAAKEPGRAVPSEMLSHGLLIARPGIGYASSVHLERFASPARLCVTDEPRLASVGGLGMLTFVVPSGQLGQALAQGTILLRPPRSIQVLLSGRVRPFVCARDIALELLRRGLGEMVRKVDAEHGAPVVLEFAGPSARLLSVGDRAVLVGIAPYLGAAAAIFVSDERTEVYLRDQRRSKAHRALVPDAGAPCDDVLNLDLGAVDPLLMDETGQVRSVRDLAGKPVAQVLLGGDSGTTLRDLFAAAALLKSKRVPSRLDFLLGVPSRQMLEVLASSGALTDLIATGARLVEPDAGVMSGAIYPPPTNGGLSLRSADPEPRVHGRPSFVVASAETLAYAIAAGEIGDPRLFKRPVRVTVPRVLPTDDVLIVRERRADGVPAKRVTTAVSTSANGFRGVWSGGQAVELVDGATFVVESVAASGRSNLAILCSSLDQVRHLALHASELSGHVQAVLAPFIPSGLVALLSGSGIAALQLDAAGLKGLRDEKSLVLPASARWAVETTATVVPVGKSKVPLTWLASTVERAWAGVGTARPAPKEAKTVRGA
jgi:aconitate hydratase